MAGQRKVKESKKKIRRKEKCKKGKDEGPVPRKSFSTGSRDGHRAKAQAKAESNRGIHKQKRYKQPTIHEKNRNSTKKKIIKC